MTFNASVVRVFIASPGDTAEERDEIERAIHCWNADRAQVEKLIMLPTRWETSVTPTCGVGPQTTIDPLLQNADIVLAVFGARLGSASADADSGTVHEISLAQSEGKLTHVYFSAANLPRNVDPRQLEALNEFKDSLQREYLFGTFNGLAELRDKVRSALEEDSQKIQSRPQPSLGASDGTRFFLTRTNAEAAMLADMQAACSMVFLGISNTSLSRYLDRTLKSAPGQLAWKEIEIYFAEQSIGDTWEGDSFSANRINAILDIWEVLRAAVMNSGQDTPGRRAPSLSVDKLPHLERVTFRVSRGDRYFNGSLFRRSEDETNIVGVEYPDMYIVFNVPTPGADAKESSTLRLTLSAADHAARKYHKHYTGIYAQLKNTGSVQLIERSPRNLWDSSAGAWRDFEDGAKFAETSHSIYEESMDRLVRFAGIVRDQHVLDVGCGTGRASSVLARAVPHGSVTLLDSSPEMIRHATWTLAEVLSMEHGDVRFAIADVRTGLPIYTPSDHFDTIVVHLALQWLTTDYYSVQDLASTFSDSLKNGGKVVLAIHNTALTDRNFAYRRDWIDPLRLAIEKCASSTGFTVRPGRITTRFTRSQIVRGFERAGFCFDSSKIEHLRRTMEDRLLLWRVPAILDSVVDVGTHGTAEIKMLMDSVATQVQDLPTEDTKMLLLAFKKVDFDNLGALATSASS